MTQNTRLLSALKKAPMTTLQIINQLGIIRPAARVEELRSVHRIETRMVEVENRFGEACRVAQYRYHL